MSAFHFLSQGQERQRRVQKEHPGSILDRVVFLVFCGSPLRALPFFVSPYLPCPDLLSFFPAFFFCLCSGFRVCWSWQFKAHFLRHRCQAPSLPLHGMPAITCLWPQGRADVAKVSNQVSPMFSFQCPSCLVLAGTDVESRDDGSGPVGLSAQAGVGAPAYGRALSGRPVHALSCVCVPLGSDLGVFCRAAARHGWPSKSTAPEGTHSAVRDPLPAHTRSAVRDPSHIRCQRTPLA